jgi:cytoplasmic iron level regulating protein YaaA (DUF328/UPF0246 family)
VLLLLPPSEGKATPPRRGPQLDLARLSFPELTAARDELLDRLVDTSGRPDALARLGVGASLAAEVEANRSLRAARTLPVSKVFTGVLYDALDLPALDPAARSRGTRRVLVFSALWGVLRPGDRIPPYRLPIGADLPGVGPLAGWWKPRLTPSLDAAAGTGLILDCRSAGYAAMWSPRGAAADHWVTVRVLRELAGRRSVVSHLAKLTRGQLVRHLLESGATPRTPHRLALIAGEAFEVELAEPERRGRPWTLDVIRREG